ncbi:hypothetical protein PVK06_008774 [Gossypium arboreum]|uniref:Inosine/uridine-preferring nucleoside hydrolase domain-containing protein n=1 Tax=Gossypium arboreum TaxID=29729 RepID=A0ABR0QKT8_GOSAR|nr:hypothetical protein PVK06_008774 [Gossypium arboreum]
MIERISSVNTYKPDCCFIWLCDIFQLSPIFPSHSSSSFFFIQGCCFVSLKSSSSKGLGLRCEANVLAVGTNVTHQVVLTVSTCFFFNQTCHILNSDRETLASSNGKFTQYLLKILEVYFNYHHDAYNTKGMYLNDPTAILVAINPSLITYVELYPSNSVMMYDCSLLSGMHMSKFVEIAEWSNQPSVKVAVTVDAPVVLNLVMERLME